MKHKRILFITAISMLFTQSMFIHDDVLADSSKKEITVLFNNKNIDFDVPPQIINNRTMIPLRAIFETLDYSVKWYESEKRIEATNKDKTIILYIGDKNIKVNENIIETDVPPQIVDGRTLVPVRVIAECSGYTVNWDNINNAVIIKTPVENSNSTNDKTVTSEKEHPKINEENNTNVPKELSCEAFLRKSIISIDEKYRIVFSVMVEGNGGDGEYMYRYEISQNDKILKKSSFAKENNFEGEINGSGEFILTVFVKDKSGTIAEKTWLLTE